MVWPYPICSGSSRELHTRHSCGTNSSRGMVSMALRTRGSRMPRLRSWRSTMRRRSEGQSGIIGSRQAKAPAPPYNSGNGAPNHPDTWGRDRTGSCRGDRASLESHLLEALLGALLGAVFLEGVRRAYARLRGQEGMGGGDVKMLAMAGAFTGPVGVFFTLFFASLAGTAVAGGAALARSLRWSVEARRARRSSSAA